ncbi:MAG: hypothetical protein U9N46_02555 [Euryarchaeota archaeon]|nr:hypothetical protein [Euryarchaeota archaeon]
MKTIESIRIRKLDSRKATEMRLKLVGHNIRRRVSGGHGYRGAAVAWART